MPDSKHTVVLKNDDDNAYYFYKLEASLIIYEIYENAVISA